MGLFGSQLHCAKLKFSCHSFIQRCLVFCHTLAYNILFLIWLTCYRVVVFANFCQSLISNFSATLYFYGNPHLGLAKRGCKPNRPYATHGPNLFFFTLSSLNLRPFLLKKLNKMETRLLYYFA
jgi:hypothetical protein